MGGGRRWEDGREGVERAVVDVAVVGEDKTSSEVFADPKVENELSEDEKGVKAKERVVRKVESIFKKPHRAAGKLTLSERKFVEETGVDGNALFNEKVPVEAEDVSELPKG